MISGEKFPNQTTDSAFSIGLLVKKMGTSVTRSRYILSFTRFEIHL